MHNLSFNASINNFLCFSEIKINDTVVKAQDELTCSLGECVSVGIGICNALEHPLSDLMLSINFYQDHHNGVNNYQLETRLSIAGANKIMLPAVSYFIDKKKILIIFFIALITLFLFLVTGIWKNLSRMPCSIFYSWSI